MINNKNKNDKNKNTGFKKMAFNYDTRFNIRNTIKHETKLKIRHTTNYETTKYEHN